VQAAAGSSQHLLVGWEAISDKRRHDRREKRSQRQQQQQLDEGNGLELLSESDEEDKLEKALTGLEEPAVFYRVMQTRKDASLLQHLAPGLRLCLAAEVAVGILCAG
jgi:hypothetical protein